MARRRDHGIPAVTTPIRRRTFLRAAGAGLASASALGALMDACTISSQPAAIGGGVEPIASGLPIERDATLRVYEWKDYLASGVLQAFAHRYADANVRIHVESFHRIDEAIARLREPDAAFDVFFPTIDVLPDLVAAGMLRPLNHDYLPNTRNLWTWFRGPGQPSYDPSLAYTVPYTVYSSGVGWRADLVAPADAPDERDPFAILWDGRYRGRLGIYDEYLEGLSLAMLRDGVVDLRDATDAQLARAADALAEAVRVAGVRFTLDGAEEGLPEGEFVAHQSWSGDVLTAPRYAEEDDPGSGADVARQLRYRAPSAPGLVVGCDLTAICARGRNPVLAHAFLDHLLDLHTALDNFAWNGYQPPLTGVTAAAFADPSFPWHAAVPSNLRNAIISEEAFAGGQMLVGFGPSEQARWLDQWNRVVPAT
jgi:spermidine/putrescine transport system substrate-binding protein